MADAIAGVLAIGACLVLGWLYLVLSASALVWLLELVGLGRYAGIALALPVLAPFAGEMIYRAAQQIRAGR